jgi:hypothetical protein
MSPSKFLATKETAMQTLRNKLIAAVLVVTALAGAFAFETTTQAAPATPQAIFCARC